jgi:hypothetical protein
MEFEQTVLGLLPKEIICVIFENLSLRNLHQIMRVCKTFKEVSRSTIRTFFKPVKLCYYPRLSKFDALLDARDLHEAKSKRDLLVSILDDIYTNPNIKGNFWKYVVPESLGWKTDMPHFVHAPRRFNKTTILCQIALYKCILNPGSGVLLLTISMQELRSIIEIYKRLIREHSFFKVQLKEEHVLSYDETLVVDFLNKSRLYVSKSAYSTKLPSADVIMLDEHCFYDYSMYPFNIPKELWMNRVIGISTHYETDNFEPMIKDIEHHLIDYNTMDLDDSHNLFRN